MWEGVSPLKVEATRGYGATVDLSPPDPAAAYDRVLEIVEEQGRVFVHPHSDPLVVAGHGTLALELLEDVPDLETVVVGTGGGGLISGIVTALDGRARVVGVAPERAQAFPRGPRGRPQRAASRPTRSPTGSPRRSPASSRSSSAAARSRPSS